MSIYPEGNYLSVVISDYCMYLESAVVQQLETFTGRCEQTGVVCVVAQLID